MAKEKRKWVRRPRVEFFGKAPSHGLHTPVAGVWHDTESHDYPGLKEFGAIVNYWRNTPEKLGAHLIIDKDGNSALCVPFNKKAYAVSLHNTGRIHIELVGFSKFTPKLWWLRIKQLNKLAKWMAYLNKEYGIPLVESVEAGWAGHSSYPGQSHKDPGRWFPKKYVLRKAVQFRENGWT